MNCGIIDQLLFYYSGFNMNIEQIWLITKKKNKISRFKNKNKCLIGTFSSLKMTHLQMN